MPDDQEEALLPTATIVASKSMPSKSYFCIQKCQKLSFFILGLSVVIVVFFLSNFFQLSNPEAYFRPLKDALMALAYAKSTPIRNETLLELTTLVPLPVNQQKLVLFWTPFFDGPWREHFHDFGGKTLPGNDDLSLNWTCFFTTDRSRLNEADAVIFHGRDFRFEDMPQQRRNSQRWCFYLLESLHHSGFSEDGWQRAGRLGLNWTLTYHRQSNAWEPYCHLVQLPGTPHSEIAVKIKRFAESFSKRPKDAVWFVSNCGTPSRREKVADRMRELGIGVDSFGSCSGNRPDAQLKELGRDGFFSRYRFYLSFENSLCEDYITEKFGNGLNVSFDHGVIPIVYGSNDYSAVAPDGSYINADAFPSVEALVQLLKKLKSDDSREMAQSYYDWHRNYQFVDCNYPKFGFTNLCRKMFTEDFLTPCRANSTGHVMPQNCCDKQENVITDLKAMMGTCRSPKLV